MMRRNRFAGLHFVVTLVAIAAGCGGDDATLVDGSVVDGEIGRDVLAMCGNGEMEPPEVCDDFNTVDGDGCSADCSSLERCGNSIIDTAAGEICDDSNTVNGDGCSADCRSDETCGNNIVDLGVGEVCDDGNMVDMDGCSADCMMGPMCGDGITHPPEACDDGNMTGGDGCSADCTSDETCGNTIIDSGEECDDGNMTPDDGCSATCTIERCGNSVIEGTEDCDDGNTTDGDGCEGDCTFTCPDDAACDDGLFCNGGEVCDLTTRLCEGGTPPAAGTDCGGGMVCRGGACVAPQCGNGTQEGTEACDDGNSMDGDGCDNDCTLSCTMDPECADTNPCNGAETCNTGSSTCTNPADLADGVSCGGGNVCRAGMCVPPLCGNGTQEGSEVCDDGNSMDGDGCDNDCTYSCTGTSDCADTNPCNGAETCNTTSHVCINPPDLPDDTSCGGSNICRGGLCVMPSCGNTMVEPGEDCDDGDMMNGDGCDNDCTWSCTVVADCTDGNACNGGETCNTGSHTCQAGTPPGAGSTCDRDMNPGTRDICLMNVCVASTCGDSYTDAGGGEDCDDGDMMNGDGCDNDCTFSCTVAGDCTDTNTCNGAETCNTGSHTCQAGTPPAPGSTCDRDMNPGTRDVCLMNMCVASICGDSYADTGGGEDCDDGDMMNGDGCDNDCTWSCTVAADCSDGLLCNGSETCNTGSHTCQPGTPATNGTLCDRDMMPVTRDICLMGSCQLSQCGDGYIDMGAIPPEACDDGNLMSGDTCEPDCTLPGVGPTAFRVIDLDIIDPHLYATVVLCVDITNTPLGMPGVNPQLQTAISNYQLNYVTVHRPLSLTGTNDLDVVDGECMAGPPETCQVGMGVAYPTTATNSPAGMTCYTADPATLSSIYTDPNTVSGPCFVTAPRDLTIVLSGLVIPFRNARVAATYSGGVPPTMLVSGVLSGFITVADAQAAVFPASVPLVGGTTLYSHLAAGGAPGSSCRTDRDDRDTFMGMQGFWFYLNLSSRQVTWSGP